MRSAIQHDSVRTPNTLVICMVRSGASRHNTSVVGGHMRAFLGIGIAVVSALHCGGPTGATLPCKVVDPAAPCVLDCGSEGRYDLTALDSANGTFLEDQAQAWFFGVSRGKARTAQKELFGLLRDLLDSCSITQAVMSPQYKEAYECAVRSKALEIAANAARGGSRGSERRAECHASWLLASEAERQLAREGAESRAHDLYYLYEEDGFQAIDEGVQHLLC